MKILDMDLVDAVSAAILAVVLVAGATYWLGVVIPERDAKLFAIMDCMGDESDSLPHLSEKELYGHCVELLSMQASR